MSPTVTILTIRGMNAVHAVRAIETAISGLAGVVRAEVSLGEARIEHSRDLAPQSIVSAVEVAGFDVESWREERRRLPTL